MTWTLCSIANPGRGADRNASGSQPGARLVFVEHGLSPEIGLLAAARLTPCWKRIGGGCHLDRKMDDLIRAAGFQIDAIRKRLYAGAENRDVHVSG